MRNGDRFNDRGIGMIRRSFTIASAISLLLCIATAALWVRSDSVIDEINGDSIDGRGRVAGEYAAASVLGRVIVWVGRFDDPTLLSDVRTRHYSNHSIADEPNFFTRLAPGTKPSKWAPGLDYGVAPHVFIEYITADSNNNSTRSKQTFGPGEILVGTEYSLTLRYYLLVALTALLPLLWISLRLRQRMKVKAGRCLACGYDLRASKDRCPECGTPIAAKTEAVT
jgi:hypothetical protein